jgi:hypothetical protein
VGVVGERRVDGCRILRDLTRTRFGRIDSYGVNDAGYEAGINEAARPRGAHLAVEQLDNGRWRAEIKKPDPLGAHVILLAAEHGDRSEALRLLLSEARRW